jgi:polygalacturonase
MYRGMKLRGFSFVTLCAAGLVAAALPLCAVAAPVVKSCDVRAFGAKGDGTTKDTAAIQKAIDSCTAKATAATPGVVKVPAGTYLTGPIMLRSNLVLELETGATLLGSPDRADFPTWTFAHKQTVQPLVSSLNAENITIRGGGTIDGNGHIWWEYVQGVKDSGVLGTDHPRPMGLVFDHSKHIRVEGITVQNSGFWQIVPYYADDLTFENIRVLAPKSPNTDGIDPFSSSHILIDHVFMSNGDDNVAIKSGAINSPGPDAPSTYITIRDCTFERGHGLSIGSEIAGGAQHIYAERIHFKGTDQGIRIKANRDRGHDVSDVRMKDIEMQDVRTAILISEYYPKVLPEGEVAAAPVTRLTPHFHDIVIENVHVVGSQTTGVIVGLPEAPVEDVTLKNVSLEGTKGFTIAYAKNITLDHVTVKATEGKDLMIAPSAQVMQK